MYNARIIKRKMIKFLRIIPKKCFNLFFKIYTKLNIEIKEKNFPESQRLSQQISLYKKMGLNRSKALKKLNKILNNFSNKIYSEDYEMSSEHLIIFTAISIKYSNIEYILEIGTYNGFTTAVLANLFPKSKIITIDLKDKDQLFIGSYNRNDKDKRNNFISQRNKLLSSFENIKFVQKNSLTITKDRNLFKDYGLIWIDWAHGYPIVCSDITNAINLAMKDTIIMCDDVWKDNRYDDSVYNSKASFQTLEAFEKAGLIENSYFFKRIGKRYLNQIKYISYSKIKSK